VFRVGSIASVWLLTADFRFSPVNGHRQFGPAVPFRATFGHVASNLLGDLHRSVVGFERA
jgi:hypothetical protein